MPNLNLHQPLIKIPPSTTTITPSNINTFTIYSPGLSSKPAVDIHIKYVDAVWCEIVTEPHILQSLSDIFTFDAPGKEFMPAYKNRKWDGKIRLIKKTKQGPMIYRGLVPKIEEWAHKNNYTFMSDIVDTWNIIIDHYPTFDSNRNILTLQEHQNTAIGIAKHTKRSIFVSPTGSGKSLIMYYITRNIMTLPTTVINAKSIIIVPTINLVDQLYNDFKTYSGNNKSIMERITKQYSGAIPDPAASVVISTWQSVYNQPESYFTKFVNVLADECHGYKSTEIRLMFEKFTNAYTRYGFTGTLDGKQVNEMVLTGIFGPPQQIETTANLIKQKKLSPLKIACVSLDYSEEEKKAVYDLEFKDEVDFLISHKDRNQFIADLALSTKGNTLVLFTRVAKHGKILYELIEDKLTETKTIRGVHFIHGGTEAESREKIRNLVASSTNNIIVASSQVFSTGVNIPSLENIIFAFPTKSKIRTLQSIGRALRKTDDKLCARVYDISDDLIYRGKNNYTYNHFIERLKLYEEEDFNYKITPIKLSNLYNKPLDNALEV